MITYLLCKKGCLTKKDYKKLRRISAYVVTPRWQYVKWISLRHENGNWSVATSSAPQFPAWVGEASDVVSVIVVPSTKIKQILSEI